MTAQEAEEKALKRLGVLSCHNMGYEDGELLRNLIDKYIRLKKENAHLKAEKAIKNFIKVGD